MLHAKTTTNAKRVSSPRGSPRAWTSFRRFTPLLTIALLVMAFTLTGLNAFAQEPDTRADLGDAPDSLSNHHGIPNTAYPGVPGRFPTVWEGTPAGEGTGPKHIDASVAWLGDRVSAEEDADAGFDADGPNNILSGGVNLSNMDRFDDGWLNRGIPIEDCKTVELVVRVSKNVPSNDARVYLNVWFDGNRDGDWADSRPCPNIADAVAHEWIVQNFVIDLGSITGTQADITVGTVLVSNEKPNMPAWMRFTLSERDAPAATAPGAPVARPPDGRGPDFPGMYQMGETEDYFYVYPVADLKADLGDAPDSSNHHGLKNPAYPSVAGQFPTVWEGTTVSGPYHANAFQVWLGDKVTSEKDADLTPDMDGVTNILDNGADANAVDKDGADDGWLNRSTATFPDCDFERLKVRIRKNPASQQERMYLNVYFDGNRNGQWGERKVCKEDPDNPEKNEYGHEWIVQNFVVNTAAITDFIDIDVPTVLIYNERKDADAWVRFMLSEGPVQPLAPFEHDGRGPQHPASWEMGETEDYLHQPPTEEAKPDLGDAPDSSNHHGLENPAYPTVPGKFPTVWEGSTPSGPMHADPYVVWLGKDVSSEKDADQLPDADGVTNILDNGADKNASNKDRFDDGWLNLKQTRFIHCEETTLKVRVSKKATPTAGKLFLNVYFDGDRSGDWGQRKVCDQTDNPTAAAYAHEWIVQNYVIPVPAGATSLDVIVPTMKVLNEHPKLPAWVRFTLSEAPVVALSPFEHDGRGPQYPNHYRTGETEDYLYTPPDDQGEPGDLRITKYNSVSSGMVNVGDVFTYSVEIAHVGGTAPAFVTMKDQLPPEVKLLHGPFVTELNPVALPLAANFNGSVGPSGEVSWNGMLTPDAKVRIDFVVGVRFCPPQNRQVIHNVAKLFKPDGTLIAEATNDLKTDCKPSEPPVIQLHKRLIRLDRPEADTPEQPIDPVDEYPMVPGDHAAYVLEMEAKATAVDPMVISDTMPAGVVAVGVEVSRGEAVIQDNGRTVIWKLRVGPEELSQAKALITVRPTERLECNKHIENIAYWAILRGDEIILSGHSNKVIAWLACSDLGDAPDSTNHFSKPMDAYPSVQANYPTVFDVTVTGAARGPKHKHTKPLHLGRGVTEEREADVGPDVDPTNNIRPLKNLANLDGRDDGLVMSEFTLDHCQFAKIPVLVSIDPVVLASLPNDVQGKVYLNIWLDSNRDGDWEDNFDCPTEQGQTSGVTWEHIVVDYAIDVAALGPGIHKIYAPTNWPVYWPPEFMEKKMPAWMRITLSERPSNKVLDCGAGTCHIGDGRGYDQPFELGETEDYLVRPPKPGDPPPTDGADPTVGKKGFLHPRRDPQTGAFFWVAQWNVHYKNAGHALATNVVVVDEMSGPQTYHSQVSVPVVTPVVSGNTLTYTVGNLGAGSGGLIVLRARLPITQAPGTIITNTVTITSSNDVDPLNNTETVTLTVPLLPPVITYPTPGTTCTGTFTVTGLVQPSAVVDLTIDDASGNTVISTTVTPDAGGHWSYGVSSLPDGEYDITAVARMGSLTSSPATVHVIVDSTLFWNPLSLRFTDDSGHTVIPHDSNGRTDAGGWRIFLRRGTMYTVSLTICCTDPNVEVTLELGSVGNLTLTDPDGDGTYTATFTTPSTGPITGAIRICVTCNLVRVCSDGTMTIDPEGTVFDILTGQPVAGSQVACMEEQVSSSGGGTVFSLWPADQFDQVNPQTTGSDGYFSFFTPPGTYRLEVSQSGYQSYRSPDLVVVSEPVHFDVPLTPAVSEDAGQEVLITAEGFDPPVLTVAPNTVIQFTNMDSVVHSSTSITPTAEYQPSAAQLKSSDAWDSGLLDPGESYKRKLTSEGTYTYVDATNPAVTGVIIVQAATTPEQKIFLPTVNR